MNPKPKNKSDFEEFTNLIEELEAPETRPYAPKLAADYKTGLRYKLLQQHEGKRLSQSEMFNLWRFAGTVTVMLVLLFALVSFIALLSNPSAQTSPSAGIGAPVTRTPAASQPVDLSDAAVVFGDRVQLVGFQLEQISEGTVLRLSWQPLAILDGKFQLFVHLIDENGELALQVDSAVAADMPLISREVKEIVESELTLQTNELPDGNYTILLGIYNSETGARLAATSPNSGLIREAGTAVMLTSWSIANDQPALMNAGNILELEAAKPQTSAHSPGQMTVSADRIVDLVLYDAPGGEPVDIILDETIELILPTGPDKSLMSVNDLRWAAIHWRHTQTGEGGICWITEDIYNRIVDFINYNGTGTPAEAGSVWLISVIQKARPSASAPLELEITLGYDFTAAEEVFLKISAAHPQWLSRGDNGRLPIDSVADPVFLNADENHITINALLTPAEARQILDTERPVLVAELGYLVTHDDAQGNQFQFLDIETFADYPLDLNIIAESIITENPVLESGEVWLISATQKARPSVESPIDLELKIGYDFQSDKNVFLKLSLARPDWAVLGANGRIPLEGPGNPAFLNADENVLTINVTSNPEDVRRILNVERPVLVIEMLSADTNGGETSRVFKILATETLEDQPLDISIIEEITHEVSVQPE